MKQLAPAKFKKPPSVKEPAYLGIGLSFLIIGGVFVSSANTVAFGLAFVPVGLAFFILSFFKHKQG